MRTTLDIDPTVVQAARALAASRSVSLGQAISDLALKGLGASTQKASLRGGIPVLKAPKGAKPVTLEDVKQALDDEL